MTIAAHSLSNITCCSLQTKRLSTLPWPCPEFNVKKTPRGEGGHWTRYRRITRPATFRHSFTLFTFVLPRSLIYLHFFIQQGWKNDVCLTTSKSVSKKIKASYAWCIDLSQCILLYYIAFELLWCPHNKKKCAHV